MISEKAEENFKTLVDCNFDLDMILNDPKNQSITNYGSEFKSPQVLFKLLGKHP